MAGEPLVFMSAGPCEPTVPCAAAERAVGERLHLRLDLTGYGVRTFVVDVYARQIVDWKASRSMATEFVLDALEQAIEFTNLSLSLTGSHAPPPLPRRPG